MLTKLPITYVLRNLSVGFSTIFSGFPSIPLASFVEYSAYSSLSFQHWPRYNPWTFPLFYIYIYIYIHIYIYNPCCAHPVSWFIKNHLFTNNFQIYIFSFDLPLKIQAYVCSCLLDITLGCLTGIPNLTHQKINF